MAFKPTPKSLVLAGIPNARLDYYETLRGAKRPCWFIRYGFQGAAITEICASPRAAWQSAWGAVKVALQGGR